MGGSLLTGGASGYPSEIAIGGACISKTNKNTGLFGFEIYNLVDNYEEVQRRQWHPTLVLLPGKSHGQRSLVGCSPWGHRRVGHD